LQPIRPIGGIGRCAAADDQPGGTSWQERPRRWSRRSHRSRASPSRRTPGRNWPSRGPAGEPSPPPCAPRQRAMPAACGGKDAAADVETCRQFSAFAPQITFAGVQSRAAVPQFSAFSAIFSAFVVDVSAFSRKFSTYFPNFSANQRCAGAAQPRNVEYFSGVSTYAAGFSAFLSNVSTFPGLVSTSSFLPQLHGFDHATRCGTSNSCSASWTAAATAPSQPPRLSALSRTPRRAAGRLSGARWSRSPWRCSAARRRRLRRSRRRRPPARVPPRPLRCP